MTTKGNDAVETLLELPVRKGEEEAVVALFRSLDIFGLAGRRVGLISARLLVPHEHGRPLIVAARWADEEAIARWVADPERERTNAELAPYLSSAGVRSEYTLALAYPEEEE